MTKYSKYFYQVGSLLITLIIIGLVTGFGSNLFDYLSIFTIVIYILASLMEEAIARGWIKISRKKEQ